MQDDTTNIQYFLTAADALDSYIRQRYCLVIMDSCLEDVETASNDAPDQAGPDPGAHKWAVH